MAKAFVGPDMPAAPTGLKALDKSTMAALSWDRGFLRSEPTVAVVFPEEVTYNVIAMKNAKEPADTLASLKDKTNFDVTSINLNDGEQQHFVYWGVSAQNQRGSGAISNDSTGCR